MVDGFKACGIMVDKKKACEEKEERNCMIIMSVSCKRHK